MYDSSQQSFHIFIPNHSFNCNFLTCISIFAECNDGMFGDLRQSQCGHCLDLSKCHHVNGTCLDGCKPGYISKFCNQCK